MTRIDDVVVVGGGPAGALTALLLARGGARVTMFDRARFPRDKLCGDSINPGALAVLERHLDITSITARGSVIDGMLLTGPGGVSVRGAYGGAHAGRVVYRRDLDQWLAGEAVAAGVRFEDGVRVTGAMHDAAGHASGVTITGRLEGKALQHSARVVVAADGRTSRLARATGATSQPAWPRRWAIGAYYDGVTGLTRAGEMHVRRGHYIGVAPMPDGRANACLVRPHTGGDPAWPNPAQLLDEAVAADPELHARFATATRVTEPQVLGPMAVDASACGAPGLLLAGDAAGFIDPITGDGLRLAWTGAELAAAVAGAILAGVVPSDTAHIELARRRRAALGGKWRFNRTVRRLVGWPTGVGAAAVAARLYPALLAGVIRYAADINE